MEWLEQLDAAVDHIPAALVIPKSEYLSLLLNAFHGITVGDNSLVCESSWSWDLLSDPAHKSGAVAAAHRTTLVLTLSTGVIKALKYPFNLVNVSYLERMARIRAFVFLPLNEAWSSLPTAAHNALRSSWPLAADSPILPPISQDSHQKWLDVVNPTRPEAPPAHAPPKKELPTHESTVPHAPPQSKLATKSGSHLPSVSSSSASTTTSTATIQSIPSPVSASPSPHSISLHYDSLGAGDELASSDGAGAPAKRKRPETDTKDSKQAKRPKYEFL